MTERNFVESVHFKKRVRIHGQLSHDFVQEGKRRWYIYLIEDIPCEKAIIGSTTNPTARWSSHKSSCNNGPCHGTGLSKHFTLGEGCPNDLGKGKETLQFSLVDFIDVSEEQLQISGHEKGPKCRCKECSRLKELEDKWIVQMGTFYGDWGIQGMK